MSRKLRVGQYQQKHLQLVVRNERRNIVPEVQHVMRDGIVRVRAGRVFQQRLERLHIITRLSSAKFQLCWDSRPQELKGRRLTAVIRSVTSSIHLAIGLGNHHTRDFEWSFLHRKAHLQRVWVCSITLFRLARGRQRRVTISGSYAQRSQTEELLRITMLTRARANVTEFLDGVPEVLSAVEARVADDHGVAFQPIVHRTT